MIGRKMENASMMGQLNNKESKKIMILKKQFSKFPSNKYTAAKPIAIAADERNQILIPCDVDV